MSLTQTYYVASTARSKLGREAGRADHNLRRLVGHANLLDTLMVELQDAEREQEAWFNQSVKKASKPDQPRHVQWIDTIAEEAMEEDDDDDSDDESDDGSDIYDEDAEMFDVALRKIRAAPVTITSEELMEDELEEDDDEEDEELALRRVPSQHSPPQLTHEEDSDSDDESLPPSPEMQTFEISEKQRQAISTTTFYDKSEQGIEDYVLAQQQQAPLIAAC